MTGIITEALVRVLRAPERTQTLFATFPSTDEAGDAVSRIIGSGIVPAAIEMCDQLAVEAIVAATGVDWPLDAGALLLIDFLVLGDFEGELGVIQLVGPGIAILERIVRRFAGFVVRGAGGGA